MALTALQRRLCHLIAENRIAAGDSDVAGAAALNEILAGTRLSHLGTCVLDQRGSLYAGDADHLRHALAEGAIVFHAGRLRGALPRIAPSRDREP